MDSQDFRAWIISSVRAFDAWAWKDKLENPDGWAKETTKEEWLKLFKEWISDDG